MYSLMAKACSFDSDADSAVSSRKYVNSGHGRFRLHTILHFDAVQSERLGA
jgi:hypothetical protein